MIRVLSLDGGGIRGIFAASLLAHVESEIGRPIRSCFDLVVGTSTGAIIALGLASGISADDVRAAYQQLGPKVFPRPASVFSKLRGPGHDNKELVNRLKRLLGERTLDEAQIPVAIPSFDASTGETRVWKSQHHPDLQRYGGQQKMWEVALASAAAPTFLPPARVSNQGSYLDGGLWANNPSMIGLVEAVRYLNSSLSEVRLMSIGTGKRKTWFNFEELAAKGLVGWALKIVEMTFDAQSQAAHNQARLLLGVDNYLRIDVELPRRIDLDDAREMPALEELGRSEGMKNLGAIRTFLEA